MVSVNLSATQASIPSAWPMAMSAALAGASSTARDFEPNGVPAHRSAEGRLLAPHKFQIGSCGDLPLLSRQRTEGPNPSLTVCAASVREGLILLPHSLSGARIHSHQLPADFPIFGSQSIERGPARFAGHTLCDQPVSKLVTDRDHSVSCLSSLPSSDGFKTIGKAFAEWTKTNCRKVKT